jgi:hypothetical protein
MPRTLLNEPVGSARAALRLYLGFQSQDSSAYTVRTACLHTKIRGGGTSSRHFHWDGLSLVEGPGRWEPEAETKMPLGGRSVISNVMAW